ncbi:concanavalin A-like lectin/glucanases superfamily protein (plasmid) [Bacillus pseudomycoides]|uniref:LamG-like jellyroll fold domain-containing protein n=1 Tax=Bacillus TaxID=1386 RepID=UPI000379EEE7|nr:MULTISPECIES: LamG-like jellyroll fold domain-containing protein [Bacillus]AIK35320.1 concanavalin A-like lectin/glucanases superfamily protein [Bacillus pseudomycoides]AJI14559.1 concanavalin A-like lectin/glucanases superfamily protein [Bacillus pseudomycoides]PEB38997.1 hypothetical protein COO06_25430 [Bacillus pseudomycoides]PGD93326.1 hypothetical protein COM50_20795 [Bacillus pseudomycoides]
MNKLTVHHNYSRSSFDLSDNRNHGLPLYIKQNPEAFVFDRPESKIRVNPSSSLQNLWSIHALVSFNLSTGGGIDRDYILIDGDHSFRLFIEKKGVLRGYTYDRTGHAVYIESEPYLITTDSWHTAELLHDGINALELYLDGVKVAERYDAVGQVRSIGEVGITIGHYAENYDSATFEGLISEFKLFKYDPYKDINGLLDSSCRDSAAIDSIVQKLRENNETAESIEAKGREILQFGLDIMSEIRGNDAELTKQQRQYSVEAYTAFLRGDQAAYTSAQARLALLAMQNLNTDQIEKITGERDILMKSLPLPFDELQSLLSALCLDKTTIDPNTLVDEIYRLTR